MHHKAVILQFSDKGLDMGILRPTAIPISSLITHGHIVLWRFPFVKLLPGYHLFDNLIGAPSYYLLDLTSLDKYHSRDNVNIKCLSQL